MDFRQLEAYVKVFELRSFSKAAEAIFLSQPSVSTYVNSLEKELKIQLIYRSTKEILPTKAGKIFYEYAKDILAIRDKSVFSIRNFTNSTSGDIEILASSVPAQYILPEILGAFHKLYPNITFHMTEADTREVIKGISAQNAEVGFVGAKIESPKCVYEYFMSERLIIITPYTDQYKKINGCDIREWLCNEYFIMREVGSGTRHEYESFLKDIGVEPGELKVSAYFSNTQSIINAVANGLGISIVSELAAKYYINQKMVLPVEIDYPMHKRDFYVVLKKNYKVSHIAEIFIDFASSYYSIHTE